MRIFPKELEQPTIEINDFIQALRLQPGQIINNSMLGPQKNILSAIVEEDEKKDCCENPCPWLKCCNTLKGIYEMNLFREIIIYSLIMQKR